MCLLLFDQVLRCWGAILDFHSLQWHVPGRLPRTRAAELFAHNVGGDTVQQRLPGRRWLGLAIAQKAGEAFLGYVASVFLVGHAPAPELQAATVMLARARTASTHIRPRFVRTKHGKTKWRERRYQK